MASEFEAFLISLFLIVPAFLYAYIAVKDANKSNQKEKKG